MAAVGWVMIFWFSKETVDTDEETGEQVLKNQVMHTMDFHVYG